jgi:hypothetical protein
MEGKGCNFQGVSVGGRKRGEAEEVVVKVEERNEGGEGEMSAIVGTSDAQLEEERRITEAPNGLLGEVLTPLWSSLSPPRIKRFCIIPPRIKRILHLYP